MPKKYSEQIVRHAVRTPDGDPGEVLERITLESQQAADGSWSEPAPYLRRFDTRTGQQVNPLEGGDFEIIETGLRLSPDA